MKQEEFDDETSELARKILLLVLRSGRNYLMVMKSIDGHIDGFSKSLENRHR
jgi:hypothetical protein